MTGTRTITLVIGEDGNPISHPTIYDINHDTRRPVTQADVDRLLAVEAAFANVCLIVKDHRDKKLTRVKWVV